MGRHTFAQTYAPVFWLVFVGFALALASALYVMTGEEEYNQESFEYRAAHHTAGVQQGFERLESQVDYFVGMVENELSTEEEDDFSQTEFRATAKKIIAASVVENIWWVDDISLPFSGVKYVFNPDGGLLNDEKLSQYLAQVVSSKQALTWLEALPDGTMEMFYAEPLLAENNHDFFGVAMFSWSVSEVIEEAISHIPVSGQHISFFDVENGNQGNLLHRHASRGQPLEYNDILKRKFSQTTTFEFVNQRWVVVFTAANTFFLAHPLKRIWDVLIFGIIVTLLMAALLAVLLRRTEMVEDMVDAKTAALVESESRFAQIVAHMPVGIAIHKHGIIQYLNPFFLKLIGNKTLDEVVGDAVLKYVHPDDQDEVKADAKRVMRGEAVHGIPVRYVTPDGERKTHEMIASRTSIISDGELSAVTIALDVTKQNQAARALERQNQTMEAVLQASPIGIWMVDQNSHIHFLNEAFAKVVNMDQEKLLAATHYRDVLSENMAWQCMSSDEACLKKRALHRSIEHFFDTDGQERIYEVIKVPLFQQDNTLVGIVGMSLDITSRLEAESEKERAQKQAEEAQKLESLGVLAGGIAHDFNNLLSVILGNAALATGKLGKDPSIAVYMSRIEEASTSAASLCNEMLAYAGKGKFTVERMTLRSVVAAMSRLLEVSLHKTVTIDYAFGEDKIEIEVDSAQIQQVIMNLITNANEAMEERGGDIRIKTGVLELNAPIADVVGNDDVMFGEYAFIEVADTGCGMDDETRSKIFEPFYTTKFTGRGLGLSAMLGMVRSHGGYIQLHSEKDKGSTFKVLFPVAKVEDKPLLVSLESSQPTEAWQGSGTVLIVDDEEVILETVAVMLEDMGFDTLLAKDGEQGVRMYQQHQQDICLVLMDMTMPRMDGKHATAEILNINAYAKVILCSGYPEEDAVLQFESLNLASFLQKPIHPDILQIAVEKVLKT